MRFFPSVVLTELFLLASGLVSGVPTVSSDPSFRFDAATMQAAIRCPAGIKQAPGGIVLLVHGTGSTGAESWGDGPYVHILPKLDAGYDVCYIDLPSRSMTDMANDGEYLAYAIHYLAKQSAMGKVKIVTHSSGGV